MALEKNDDDLEEKGAFICPECGSTNAGGDVLISTDYDPEEPWSEILRTITCGGCGREIPAHLGERWNGRSVEEARKEWREVYRRDD